MYIKRNIAYFISLIVLFGVISSGCSKEEEEMVNNNNQITGETEQGAAVTEALEPNEDSSEDTSKEPSEEQSEESDSEDNSIWKLVSESTVETAVFYAGFLNESTGVTVGYSGATSYTEDGGKTWSKSSNVSACRYGLDFYDESFIIDSGNSGVNMVSKDKGNTWAYLGEFPLKNSTAYNKFLSVVDLDNIYIGSKLSLGVSNDSGATWRELELPEGCKEISGMFFLTPETGYLLDPTGTLYKTVDSCETWTTQQIDTISSDGIANTTMPSAAINFKDEKNGMIVYIKKGLRLGCLKTEDGGSTWEYSDIPKVFNTAPYISRDGQYLTLSSSTKKISLYKLED